MGNYRLVVSNPPQLDVSADRAAPLLGLTPEQFEAKVRYGVPEIWFAHPDGERATDVARALVEAGCRVALFDSHDITTIPVRNRVRSFSFTDRGLTAHADTGDTEVEYDAPVDAVFCRPRESSPDLGAGSSRRSRSSSFFSIKDRLTESGPTTTDLGTPDDDIVPFLDIYVPAGGKVQRFTVQQNAVNFSGLGRVQPRAAANMEALVGSCEDRFGAERVDRRLVGMRLRHRSSRRAPGSEHRRGFSYASPGLLALLAALDPALASVSQAELSTRLAYLTHRQTP
jgi:hypothetical protein